MANELQLKDFVPIREAPQNLVKVPTLLETNPHFCRAVLEEYERIRTEYGNPDALDALDSEGRGCNPPVSALLWKILEPTKFRPAIPADDRDGSISKLVENKHYTDFNALVVRSNKPTYGYGRNKNILTNIIETTEENQGSVKFPFMVTGVAIEPWPEDSEKGYGLRFVPGDNFAYVHDERLDGKEYPTGTKFKKLDDLGLFLPDKNGTRTWYAKEGGLSRFYLYDDLFLVSNNDDLHYSIPYGRVIIVSGEASDAEK